MLPGRRTKIVATVGPATDDEGVLDDLISAGVNAVRVSLAHGDPAEARARIQAVRRAAAEAGTPVGVLVDLPGPKLRVCSFPEGGAWLARGTTIELRDGGDDGQSDASVVEIEGDGVVAQLRPGDRVALGDGGLALAIQSVAADGGRASANVLSSGRVQGRPGLHLPASRISVSTPTSDDIRLLGELGTEQIDAVAVSFVRAADDVVRARESAPPRALIVAKIETQEAVDNLDAIVEVSDAIMVARGDLGVRCRFEDVPHFQKRIIKTGIYYGRPVITATQMLESMVSSPVPTRAEVTDVANAVFDGTSALMLSGETAIGHDPAAVVRTMSTIAHRAEQHFDHVAWADRLLDDQPARLLRASPTARITEAASAAAYRAAIDAGAVAVIAATNTGTTARVIARFRPPVPILAVTPVEATFHQLTLSWGVDPVLARQRATTDEIVWFAVKEAVERGLAKPDDLVAVLAGDPTDPQPATDTVRLVRVR